MNRNQLAERFLHIRRQTEALSEPLDPEDCVVQSMPDASPTKWHLAHTSWFFETFVLRRSRLGYRALDDAYLHLFNSYYKTVGTPYPRPRRGILSRPSLAEVLEFRHHVDRSMSELLSEEREDLLLKLLPVIELGMNHEQQHQELILTDIKHLFEGNPLAPVYRSDGKWPADPAAPAPQSWIAYEPGTVEIGHEGADFAFDNEEPRHTQYLHPYALAGRPVTCGEFLEFIESGGYERVELWLADGWEVKEIEGWRSPLYWRGEGSSRQIFTLSGIRPLNLAEPVCHVSYYEADAFARWAGARLPTEAEWEHAAKRAALAGNFLESERFHPGPAPAEIDGLPVQLFGDVWEWTASAYLPYPGFQPPAGALGEYNGKFMVNQMVLRGGSCASPASHLRATYRNFFPPNARWQFTGIRLAK